MSLKPEILIISLGIVLLIFCVLISRDNSTTYEAQITVNSHDQAYHARKSNEVKRPSKRRTKTSSEPAFEATHRYAELKNFIIPELKLEGITFKQALYALRKQYYETCKLTGETPISFHFTIENSSQRPINFVLEYAPFTSMLQVLAALEGMHMQVEGREISFTRIEKSGSQASLNLSPAVTEKVSARLSTGTLDDYHLHIGGPEFALISILNIPFDLMERNDEPTQIIVDSSDIQRIEALLENYVNLPQAHIKISTRLVKILEGADSDLNLEVDLSSNAKLIAHLMILSRAEGVDIITLPSVLASNGEPAKIELLQEYVFPNSSGGFKSDNTGITFHHLTNQLGFGVSVDNKFDEGYLTNNEYQPVKHLQTKHKGYSQLSTPLVIQLNTSDGSKSYLITTYTELDASGAPTNRSP